MTASLATGRNNSEQGCLLEGDKCLIGAAEFFTAATNVSASLVMLARVTSHALGLGVRSAIIFPPVGMIVESLNR